jgi:hypothetical protein
MKLDRKCMGTLLSAVAAVTTAWPCLAASEGSSEPAATVVPDSTAPLIATHTPAVELVTTATPSSAALVESAPAPLAESNPLPLSGYVKHRHHPFLALLRKEFDSPVHAITTNNRNF